MRKLAINIVAALALAVLGYLWIPEVKAQCTGVFPSNTLCGNLSGVPAPPHAFSANTSVFGPGTTTTNGLVTWGNTAGTQLRDASTATSQAIVGNYNFSGIVSLSNTTIATSNNNGALVLSGGIGGAQSGSTSTVASDLKYNNFQIINDQVNAPNLATYVLYLELDTQQGKGQKYALRGLTDLTAPSSTSGDLVGLSGWAISNQTNGGTTSQFTGTLYGLEGIGHAFSGATSYFVVSGGEVDAIVDAGATAKHRWGWSVVSNTANQGSTSDGALEIGSVTATQWKNGILLDNFHSFAPISTSGCLICTDGSANTITTGIDLGTYTITGNNLNFPNFTVTGAGATIANGTLQSAGVLSTGVNGLGFKIGTGTGGAVTQLTSRTTAVTSNTPTGTITLVSAAGTSAVTTFPLNNSLMTSLDTAVVSQKSGTDRYLFFVSGVGTGGMSISVIDETGTTTEQPAFNYTVIKGSNN